MATGKLFCATTGDEIPYYLTVNESVFFAHPGTVESFADAMCLALSDPECAKRVGKKDKQVSQEEFNNYFQVKK